MVNLSVLFKQIQALFKRRILLSIIWASFAGCSGLQTSPSATLVDPPSKGPVGKTFHENASKFEACAQDSVSIQTGTTQSIDLLFWVNKEGRVLKASIEKMTEPDPDLHQCVLRVLRKIIFPKPNDLMTHKVIYQIKLKQG